MRLSFLFFIFIPFLHAKIDIYESMTGDSGVFKAKYSHDLKRLLLHTVSDDIKLIDVDFMAQVAALQNNKDVTDVDLSGDGSVLLACDHVDNQFTDCRYYQEKSFSPVLEFRLEEVFFMPRLSFDGRYLLGVSEGRVLKILDVVEMIESSSIELGSDISTYGFSDNLRWILIGTITGHYHLWDTLTGMVVLEDNFKEPIFHIEVSENYALVTGRFQDDRVINLKDLSYSDLPNNDNSRKKLPSQIISAHFHPFKNNIVALARPADIIELWDHSSAQLIEKVKIPMMKKSRFKRPTPLNIKWSDSGVLYGVTAQGEIFTITFEENK